MTLAALLLCSVCVAQAASDSQIREYVERCREATAEAITEYTESIATQKRALAKLRRSPVDRRNRNAREKKAEAVAKAEEAIRDTEEKVKLLKGGETLRWVKIDGKKPVVGQIGRLPDTRVRIVQITGPKDMLVRVQWFFAPAFTIVNPHGGRSTRIPKRDYKVLFWVRGIRTDTFADDSMLTLNRVFCITGNKTYESFDGGSQTVLVLEPIEMSRYLKAPPVMRTWTTADKKFSVRARFLRATDDTVTLEKEGGGDVTVPIAILSEADRRYVAGQR